MFKKFFLFFSLVLLLLTMLLAVGFGSVNISLGEIFGAINSLIRNGMGGVDMTNPIHFIIFEVRIPRIILASLTGGLLAMAGATYQAIFQNPMADPYVMGVSSGAAFGATLAIVFLPKMVFLGHSLVSLSAFLSAIVVSLIVYLISRTRRGVDNFSILLTGIIISAILSSLISLIMMMHKDEVMAIISWTMGSFNAKSWLHVATILLPAVLGLALTIYHGKDLNLLVMGEEEATSMGLNVKRLKRSLLLICALLTALAVSVSGIIGFVGLIVPHFIRLAFGSDHRFLLPASMVYGGIFMLICDTLARSIIPSFELPVGIITSIIGGPLFLVLLIRYRRNPR